MTNPLALLFSRLRDPDGRYLLSVGLTREERDAQEAPTYGGKGTRRWLTDEEYAALCALAISPSHEPFEQPRISERDYTDAAMHAGLPPPTPRDIQAMNAVIDALYENREGASRDASSVEPVFRKWPGEPPHCMSCSCGMTDQQKRTVPEADYLRIHKEMMNLKYPGSSPDSLVGALQDVVHTHPGPVRARKAHREPK